MTHHPILDGADQTPAVPLPSSANGTRPNSVLVAARDPAQVDMDDAARPAADLYGEQRVVDLDAADRPVDLDAAEPAAAGFLTALGIDLDREERRATPGRMARAYAELFAAQPFRLTTFPNDEGYDELVMARATPGRPSTTTRVRDRRSVRDHGKPCTERTGCHAPAPAPCPSGWSAPPALEHLFTDKQGFGWLPEDDFVYHFAADVDPVRARVMHAVQQPATSTPGRP